MSAAALLLEDRARSSEGLVESAIERAVLRGVVVAPLK